MKSSTRKVKNKDEPNQRGDSHTGFCALSNIKKSSHEGSAPRDRQHVSGQQTGNQQSMRMSTDALSHLFYCDPERSGTLQPPPHTAMARTQTEAPRQFGIRLSAEVMEQITRIQAFRERTNQPMSLIAILEDAIAHYYDRLVAERGIGNH